MALRKQLSLLVPLSERNQINASMNVAATPERVGSAG